HIPRYQGDEEQPMSESIALPYGDPAFAANPFPFYAALRERGPVVPIVFAWGLEGWLITGYEDGLAALSDPRLSSALAAAARGGPAPWRTQPTAGSPGSCRGGHAGRSCAA